MTRIGNDTGSTTARRDRSSDDGYTVRAGDTLTAIARSHGCSLHALIAANPQIRDPNLILVGQHIHLPSSGAAAPAQRPAAPGPTSGGTHGPRLHPTGGVDPSTLQTPDERALVPANAHVAVIGDSHTAGTFGSQLRADLDKHLQRGGGRLDTFEGVPSAGVNNFLHGTSTQAGSETFHTPKIDDVLKSHPDVLVVGLGSNMLGNSIEGNKQQIRALLDKADAAGTRVVWVGPPQMKGFGGNLAGDAPEARFYKALHDVEDERRAAGKTPLRIVDSRGSTRENDTVDGVHFSGTAARRWAADVAGELTQTRGAAPTGASGGAQQVTGSELRQIVRNLSPGKAEEVATHLNDAMREAGIKTTRQKAAFIAQLAHESGGFHYMEEIASGAAYEGRRDLGNTQPGDGVRFKGRGYIQVTGRANYDAAGRALGLDLVNHPELAARPENAARIAAWFWKSRGLNAVAERGDFKEVTRRINGGYNGLASRETYYRHALQVLDGGQAPAAAADEAVRGRGGRYVVEGGDTLSEIAERFGTSVADILAANPQLTSPRRIYPGQELTIPPAR